MFTGIITDVSALTLLEQTDEGVRVRLQRPAAWTDVELGESISINGVCLTVEAMRDDSYDCFMVPETLSKTSFGAALPERVNVERALRMSDRLGGHFVQGHVDDTGLVTAVDDEDGRRLTIQFKPEHRDLVIYKGSITINGVSLTVAAVNGDKLEVALIPHTLTHTTLEDVQVGDAVNIEFDVLGKYVLNSMKVRSNRAKSGQNEPRTV